jgi:hypothetical protein
MPAGSGRYPSGQRGQTVNLLAYAFGGSNPPLPTIVATGVGTDRTAGGLFEVRVAPTRPDNGPAVVSGDASCGNSSAVERQPSKLGVAGSNPVSRSIVATALSTARAEGGLAEAGVAPISASARDPHGRARTVQSPGSAHVAQLAEHALGKGEVSGSIPDMGSRLFSPTKRGAHGR